MKSLQTFGKFALAAFAATSLLASAASAQTAMPREDIEKIIREYIMKNPEIVRDAIVELRKRDEQAEVRARGEALQANKEKLFNSPRGIVVGNPKGNVTLVEFYDYNCGYCKRALNDVVQLTKSDPNLKIVLRQLPILSPGSVEAARIGVAVRLQDPAKYFAFHQILMSGRGEANAARALAAAQQAGLDVEKIKKDLTNPEIDATLQESAELSEALKISGTPTYIIGDQIVPGALPYAQLSQAIAMIRKCGKVEC